METMENTQLDEVVLVRTDSGKVVRYARLEDVPAEFAATTMTTDELRDMRKEDLEAIYLHVSRADSPKTFPTHQVALESVVYNALRMPTVVPDSPEEVKFEIGPRRRREPKPQEHPQSRGKRAPERFKLSYPQGLENVLKGLAPQAQTIIKVLVEDAERRGSVEFTHKQVVELLNTDEVREALNTRQEPERIFTYYRSKLEARGVLVGVLVGVLA